MLGIKAGIIVLSLSIVVNAAGACGTKRGGNARGAGQSEKGNVPANNQPVQDERAAFKGELKTLAQGQHGSIANAFIFVARDAEAYSALRQAVPGLQALDENFFQSNAVVAGFLGERRTGGYGVKFNRTADGQLLVEETRPPRGSMSTQVITYPFAVVAVPVRNQESLALEPANSWRAMIRPYSVKEGDFTMSGGIAGRSQKFLIKGSLGMMREGNLVTLFLDLQGKNGTGPSRRLKDAGGGVVQAGGRLAIGHLGADTFVDQPADALRATGQLSANEKQLSLTFDSIPGRIADGYNGRGSLTAETRAPAPQKRKRSGEDAPL
jgi:hypothetical protein